MLQFPNLVKWERKRKRGPAFFIFVVWALGIGFSAAVPICGVLTWLDWSSGNMSKQQYPDYLLEIARGVMGIFIVSTILGLMIGAGLWVLFESSYRHMIENGYCRRCRYDLHGTLKAGRTSCPECGLDIHPEQQQRAHSSARHGDDS